MSVIDLFWHLDLNDQTKYIIIFGLIVCLILCCTLAGKKKGINKIKGIKRRKNNK